MLLSFQPSKNTLGLCGFWPDALSSQMFAAVLAIPWLCLECSNEVEKMGIETVSLSMTGKESERKDFYS